MNMYLPKHGRKRTALVAACCVALAMLCLTGVYAWYSQQDSLTNTFIKGETAPVINETDDTDGKFDNDVDTVKKNVYLSINDGCIDVWVRAQVSIQWQDAGGNIMWDEPVAGEDYSVEWGNIKDPNALSDATQTWVKGADGFYYWSVPLVAKNSDTNKTANLINEVKVLKKYDDGRQLVVDIAAQSLEAKVDSFNDAWKASGFTAVEGADSHPIHLIKPVAGTSN